MSAIVLGPDGVGFVGLANNVVTVFGGLAAFGISDSGARQIAASRGPADTRAARRAIVLLSLALALLGGLAVILFSSFLSAKLFESSDQTALMAWLSVATLFSVLAGGQRAIIAGERRIEDLARLSVISGVASTVVGVGVLLLFGSDGIIAYVASAPILLFATGVYLIGTRQQPQAPAPVRTATIAEPVKTMLRLGLALTIGSVIGSLSQLLIRWIIQADYGAFELGIFQAAWMVSVVYMSFLFSAMASDFYPRLTAVIHDRRRAGLLINRQLEVCMLLGTPVILVCTALSPIIVALLFTSEFARASELLRWLIVADFFKVIFWAPGFVLLAGGHGRLWVLCEAFNAACFVGLSWVLIGPLGLAGVGIAYAVSMAVYMPLIAGLAYRYVRFPPSRAVVRLIIKQAAALAAVLALRSLSLVASEIVGVLLALLFSIIAVRKLGPSLPGPFGTIYMRLVSRRRA